MIPILISYGLHPGTQVSRFQPWDVEGSTKAQAGNDPGHTADYPKPGSGDGIRFHLGSDMSPDTEGNCLEALEIKKATQCLCSL